MSIQSNSYDVPVIHNETQYTTIKQRKILWWVQQYESIVVSSLNGTFVDAGDVVAETNYEADREKKLLRSGLAKEQLGRLRLNVFFCWPRETADR